MTACQEKPSVSSRHVSERGKVYFRKPRNLASHRDPVSAAVWWSNCTVMAFYVVLLRWLIIYTLHTLSSCSSDSQQINDRHDGKVLTQRNGTRGAGRREVQRRTESEDSGRIQMLHNLSATIGRLMPRGHCLSARTSKSIKTDRLQDGTRGGFCWPVDLR